MQWERTGELDVATEPHQLQWLTGTPPEDGDSDVVRWNREQVQEQVHSPSYLGGTWRKHEVALVHPGRLARELARAATELGVEIFENSPVRRLDAVGDGVEVVTDAGRVHASHVALGTSVFPSLLKRTRLMTVPVYDYVLMTEPLDARQLASIGWKDRQGIGDLANQFHYSRRTADDRILFGGYDAVYRYGGRVRATYEDRPESFEKLASHFFTLYPQLEGLRFSHKWAGAIDTSTRFCAFFGTARAGRVAYAAGFTGLGVGATRFAADTMLDLLSGRRHRTHRARDGAQASGAVPARARRIRRHRRHPLVARPRRPPRGFAQHAAAHARRARPGVRLVSWDADAAARCRSTHEPVAADQAGGGCPDDRMGGARFDGRRRRGGRVGDDARHDERRRSRTRCSW